MKKEHVQVGHQQQAYPNLCTFTLETEMHFIHSTHMDLWLMFQHFLVKYLFSLQKKVRQFPI
jgi:hypothetical protein